MQSYLTAALRNKPADYLEIRVEDTQSTTIEYRGKEIETLSLATRYGGNVRALVNGGWGFVCFNNPEDIEAKISKAIEQATLIGGKSKAALVLAPIPAIQDRVSLDEKKDPRRIALTDKIGLLDSYNRIVLEHGGSVSSSSVRYSDTHTKLWFGNSEGAYIEQEKMDVNGTVSAIATRDGQTQVGRTGFGSSDDPHIGKALDDKVVEACKTAEALLDAPAIEGGQYTVILDPVLAGIFAHEAFGHLSEADMLYENPALLEIMVLGRRFGAPHLNIYDTGLDVGARGHIVYDDEGVRADKTDLIREGLLVGRLHSRETASRMGERPTGNARAISFEYPPIVRMRNTTIGRGEAAFEEMLKDIKLGVYAVDSYGGQTNGEMFTFSAGQAYMIRDGEIAELVKDVNLTGNVFQTLKDIDMVGSDFARPEAGGGCGKGGQSPLPTSQWAPSIRVRNVIVGGDR